jgi:glucose-6-phosphate 1-dehydrogenase
MQLQPVNMRFNYGEAFRAPRGTGYEVMLHNAMIGDATLFSRTDFVETAWTIAQPFLDAWSSHPPIEFPNYPAGTWGPQTAHELIERDGRSWFENINREILERVPLFRGGEGLFLAQIGMALKPVARGAGDVIIKKGDPGHEMYLICNGEVEVLDGDGRLKATMGDGDFFGEAALLLSEPRNATVRARTPCNLFVLNRADFARILRDHAPFAKSIAEIAATRYDKTVSPDQLLKHETGTGGQP